MQRAVELNVGGQRYRVVSSASPEELERLARVVDDKIAAIVPPGRAITPQSMLLAAIALAHDLEEERRRSSELARDARGALERIVNRVDEAIASVDATVGQERASSRGSAGRDDERVEVARAPRLTSAPRGEANGPSDDADE